ncbi:hypothetical protein [Streptomyces sp. NPDC006446]|uniref:hypothetical protein n=1 Tax=Streptomyces sp. NPDC006446 TaxID=3154301 RepID=UPI0033A4531D
MDQQAGPDLLVDQVRLVDRRTVLAGSAFGHDQATSRAGPTECTPLHAPDDVALAGVRGEAFREPTTN